MRRQCKATLLLQKSDLHTYECKTLTLSIIITLVELHEVKQILCDTTMPVNTTWYISAIYDMHAALASSCTLPTYNSI